MEVNFQESPIWWKKIDETPEHYFILSFADMRPHYCISLHKEHWKWSNRVKIPENISCSAYVLDKGKDFTGFSYI